MAQAASEGCHPIQINTVPHKEILGGRAQSFLKTRGCAVHTVSGSGGEDEGFSEREQCM